MFVIAGLALNKNNALFLLSADGQTGYYPPNPSSNGTKLTQNISINLGAPGNTVTVTIPQLAGARLWFSIGTPLTFAVNPGPGLVEPSVFNPSDPNINTTFGFCEFTFSSQLFVNISYVDFVGLPISLTLTDTSGVVQHVSGLSANGMSTIINGLTAQTAKDGQPWSSLAVKNSSTGKPLRILSPNSYILLHNSAFSNYWTSYVNQVYSTYTSQPLTVDSQAQYGNVKGQVSGGNLNFGNGCSFPMPSAADIFSCSTGPFATGSNAEVNTLIPRLAAAFNRSTMLLTNNQPDGVCASQYYTASPTNVSTVCAQCERHC